jgi:hypothetical protein
MLIHSRCVLSTPACRSIQRHDCLRATTTNVVMNPMSPMGLITHQTDELHKPSNEMN